MRDKSIMPVWPGWETVRVIGKGSFGAVYEIQREFYGDIEKAAMKVMTIPQDESEIEDLRAEGLDNASISTTYNDQLRNIVQEYSLMRKMNGTSNVVNCDDVLVEELDDGVSKMIKIKMELLTCMNRVEFNMSPEELALTLGRDICIALELCESRSIIHRDIKPNNIFVSENGLFKLGDFGVSRTMERTSRGTKTGTPDYMAPEVYRGESYNSSVDLYSLGIVLYWILNEKRTPFLPLPPAVPLMSDRENARYRRFSGEPLPAPKNGSPELVRIVMKACAYRQEERYHQARELRADLERLAVKEQINILKTTHNVISDSDSDKTILITTGNAETPVSIPVASAPEDNATVALSQNEQVYTQQKVPANIVINHTAVERIADNEQTVLVKNRQARSQKKAIATEKKKGKKPWVFVGIAAFFLVGIISSLLMFKKLSASKVLVPVVNAEGEITNAMKEIRISKNDSGLYFSSVAVTKELMKEVCKQKELTYLSFSNCVFQVDLNDYLFPEKLYSFSMESCIGVSNFAFIREMDNLARLRLVNSNVNNTLVFSQNVEVVELSNNSEFSLLTYVPVENLRILAIDGTSVENIDRLENATKLREFYAQNSKVKNISSLMQLQALEKLNIANCPVKHLSGPFMSTGLKELCVSGCDLNDSDMKVFDYLTRLEGLVMQGNSITEAMCLEQSVETLKILNVAYNPLSERTLQMIGQAVNLTTLVVSGIQMKSLDICNAMNNLQFLIADGCGLESMVGLGGKSSLTLLDLSDNNLTSESFVVFKMNPTKWDYIILYLANNKITSIAALPQGFYDFLVLNGNPVDWTTLPGEDKMTGNILSGDYADGMEHSVLSSEHTFTMLFAMGIPGNKWEDVKGLNPLVYPTTSEQMEDLLAHPADFDYWQSQDRTYR